MKVCRGWIAAAAALLACSPPDGGGGVIRQDARTAAADSPIGSIATPSGGQAGLPAAGNGPATRDAQPVILFLGTSLTAGLGLPADEAYPAVLQTWLDSAGLAYRVVNAGVSGETSAGGLRRLDWLLEQPFEVLVLELGANDGLRGHDPAGTRASLQEIIDRVRARYPEAGIVIAGMEAPPNLGDAYTSRFRNVFTELAAANDAALVPFLLEGVAGEPGLNQSDGIHPTTEGQRIVAANVWRVLEPLLRARDSRGR
jgi:acyl-CoA thioesterase-1